MNFSQRIAYIRFSRHLTQEALAHKLGVTPQAVSKWETGMSTPDFDLLPKIAEALDISLDVLFGLLPFVEEQEPKQPQPTSKMESEPPEAKPSPQSSAASSASSEESETPNQAPKTNAESGTHTETETESPIGEDGSRNGRIPCQDIKTLNLQLMGALKIELHTVEDADAILWTYEGSPALARALRIEPMGQTLTISTQETKPFWGNLLRFRQMTPQRLHLYLPTNQEFAIEGSCMGAASFDSECHHPDVTLECSGGNTLTFSTIGTANFTISGGNTIRIQKQEGDFSILTRGASSLRIQEKYGALDLHSQGASSTKILSGHLTHLDLHLTGSGSLNGDQLEVDELSLRCAGVSTVVLDHVHKIRQARTGKASTLKIRKIGD